MVTSPTASGVAPSSGRPAPCPARPRARPAYAGRRQIGPGAEASPSQSRQSWSPARPHRGLLLLRGGRRLVRLGRGLAQGTQLAIDLFAPAGWLLDGKLPDRERTRL